MRGITIKLPDDLLRRIREQARESGRSVASIVRECLEAALGGRAESVYSRTKDLAGSLDGSRKAATNARKRFRRT